MNIREDLVRTNKIKPYFFSDSREPKCSYFTQKLPKSNIWIYWIVFKGKLEKIQHIRFFKWRINEIADKFYTNLIVDIREVNLGSDAIDQFTEIFGSSWFYFSSLIFLANVNEAEILKRYIPEKNLTTSEIEAFSKMVER